MPNTTAKGSMGERSCKRILLSLGWPEVVDLARTYPGADLWCRQRRAGSRDAYLWVEAKRYPWNEVKPESRQHAYECWRLHWPDTHLVVCLQGTKGHARREWRVVRINGLPFLEDPPLLINFEPAKPPSAAEPPYTGRGNSLRRGSAGHPGWAKGVDGNFTVNSEG
jgi:hypothetical protein